MKAKWGSRMLRAVADSMICGLCFFLLNELFWSRFAGELPVERLMVVMFVLCAVFALLSALLQGAILRRMHSREEMAGQTLLSLCLRVLFLGLYFRNLMTLRIHLLPEGEFHDAHGILYIFVMGPYLLCSALLRLVLLVISMLRVQGGTKKEMPESTE